MLQLNKGGTFCTAKVKTVKVLNKLAKLFFFRITLILKKIFKKTFKKEKKDFLLLIVEMLYTSTHFLLFVTLCMKEIVVMTKDFIFN